MTVTLESFLKDVADHRMTVLADDGEHCRHLRFREAGTTIAGFDLLTWDDYLLITGDMGSWLFQRTTDMFTFFRTGIREDGIHLNPSYWSEKLEAVDGRGQDCGPDEFSSEKFKKAVKDHFDGCWPDDVTSKEEIDLKAEIWAEIQSDVLSQSDNEWTAYNAINDFEHKGFTFQDFFDGGARHCREWKGRFIWCLYGIVWGIQQYDARVTP